MHRLRKEDYFTPESMLARQPLIFEHHMGNTRQPANEGEPTTLSSILIAQGQRMAMKELLEKHRAEEVKSEHDSDDEEEGQKALSDEERLRDCTREMEDRFLEGLDDFDYGEIDNNEGLDDDWSDLRDRDAEDEYFHEVEGGEEGGEEGEGEGEASKEASKEVRLEVTEEWETMTFENGMDTIRQV